MKNDICKRILSVLLVFSMMMMFGCMEDLSSGSQTNNSEVQKTTEVTTIKNDDETHENTQERKVNSNSNIDSELGIDFPRPTGAQPLKNGSKGDDVRWLQTALNKTMNANLTVDGDFGNGTAGKVFEFQSRCGLSADGIVGTATIAMLVDILSGNKKMPEAPKVTSPPATKAPSIAKEQPAVQSPQSGSTYVLNIKSRKFHYSYCSSVNDMNESNKDYYSGSRDDLISMGYEPCKRCNP